MNDNKLNREGVLVLLLFQSHSNRGIHLDVRPLPTKKKKKKKKRGQNPPETTFSRVLPEDFKKTPATAFRAAEALDLDGPELPAALPAQPRRRNPQGHWHVIEVAA